MATILLLDGGCRSSISRTVRLRHVLDPHRHEFGVAVLLVALDQPLVREVIEGCGHEAAQSDFWYIVEMTTRRPEYATLTLREEVTAEAIAVEIKSDMVQIITSLEEPTDTVEERSHYVPRHTALQTIEGLVPLHGIQMIRWIASADEQGNYPIPDHNRAFLEDSDVRRDLVEIHYGKETHDSTVVIAVIRASDSGLAIHIAVNPDDVEAMNKQVNFILQVWEDVLAMVTRGGPE